MDVRFIQGWTPLTIDGQPVISMCVAAYKRVDPLLCLIYSLKSQTYPHWELIIYHDGPCEIVKQAIEKVNDERVKYYESAVRSGGWHSHRQKMIDLSTGSFICMSNDDNYYCPVYFEWMLHEHQKTGADFVYCNMVHSHWKWIDFRSLPRKFAMDLGAWTAKADLVKNTPWLDFELEGDGTYIETLLQKSQTISAVPGYLFVHN